MRDRYGQYKATSGRTALQGIEYRSLVGSRNDREEQSHAPGAVHNLVPPQIATTMIDELPSPLPEVEAGPFLKLSLPLGSKEHPAPNLFQLL